MSQPASLIINHLSDPHLSNLKGVVKPRHLTNKRIMGYLSWYLNRRHEHLPKVLDALIADIHQLTSDHTVITGDMTHIGLPGECEQVLTWLKRLGQPQDVTVVPGNHDCYIKMPWDKTLGRWQPYMESDRPTQPLFPTVRERGSVVIIGLSTAHPSKPGYAIGTVGKAQRQRLEQILTRYQDPNWFKLVMLHHPLLPHTVSQRKWLTDHRELTAVLQQHPVHLVLHGHSHTVELGFIENPARRTAVIGIPSSSAISDKPSHRATYNRYAIQRQGASWHITLQPRHYSAEQSGFVAGESQAFQVNP